MSGFFRCADKTIDLIESDNWSRIIKLHRRTFLSELYKENLKKKPSPIMTQTTFQ